MTHYSVHPKDQIFVKGYRFLSFANNMGKNLDKRIRRNLSSIYSWKRLDHDKQSATDALKTVSKKAKAKLAEATADLIGSKIANNITKVSKKEYFRDSKMEIPKERYISPD